MEDFPEDARCWWLIHVYDPQSQTYTELNQFGLLDDIIEDLESKGDWQYVSAEPEEED